jgi:D-alanyl-lipoteichoic acid acyltransferase DltB (MBOAT superfamily)
MVVNSVNFFIFFSILITLYYAVFRKSAQWQNVLLLAGSYFFYAFAEWKMLPLLIGATAIFYFLGILIENNGEEENRKGGIITSIGVVLGIGLLVYFKYLNFFIESFSSLFNRLGFQVHAATFKVLLPLGISFYTFKLISYVIEVNRGTLKASRNFIDFSVYVAFFPTILSGPIDRPKAFLTQLTNRRSLTYDLASVSFKRIVWGMFMKMCVADRLAIYVNAVFDNAIHHNGTSLTVAALLYPIQMYADFCGYSEMAIGVGGLLGMKITENFRRPFFSVNIADYWRKWHISLTSWLTDYVFMPLNIQFRNLEKWGSILAIIITFVLIGMWHGASWTFAVFGLYHGLLYIPLMLSGAFFKSSKSKKGVKEPVPMSKILRMVGTFLLVAVGLVLFRSPGLADAFMVYKKMLTSWGSLMVDSKTFINGFLCMFIMFYKDIRDEFFPRQPEAPKSIFQQYRYEFTVAGFILLILFFGVFDGTQFIYFQF